VLARRGDKAKKAIEIPISTWNAVSAAVCAGRLGGGALLNPDTV
jgi:hypothetical protein